jgi:hypothetical protein
VRPIPDTDLSDFESPYGYGGPVATTEDPAFLAEAWEGFAAWARRERVIAGLLRFHPLLQTERFARHPDVQTWFDRETVVLDLSRPLDAVVADYARDNRNRLKAAAKAGVRVERAGGHEALRTFAAIYADHMEELGAHESYQFGVEYFDAVANLGPDAYRVYLACRDGQAIGGALVLLSQRFAHYHLSAARREHFGLAPNNALRDAVIRDLLGGPWQALHMGGGRTSDPADPLLAFKAKFSKERARYFVGRMVVDAGARADLARRWAERHPERVAAYGAFVLCYRY